MDEYLVRAVASAVLAQARRACRAKQCGVSDGREGAKWRHTRCDDCPLDDIDGLLDALAGVPGAY